MTTAKFSVYADMTPSEKRGAMKAREELRQYLKDRIKISEVEFFVAHDSCNPLRSPKEWLAYREALKVAVAFVDASNGKG